MAQNLIPFKRELLKKQLLKESAMVATDSMDVLEEFERFEEILTENTVQIRDEK